MTTTPADTYGFDRALILELARCFARAAVDEFLADEEREALFAAKRRNKPTNNDDCE